MTDDVASFSDYPWHLALDEVDGMVGTADADDHPEG